MNSKTLIVVVGTTAIGKTALAISLAKGLDTEILSADSRQFYREMQIGTAVPDAEQLQEVPHHFIQHLSIEDSYNVGQFEEDALQKLNLIFAKKDHAVLVGGSGLYIDAVVQGLDKFPPVPDNIRDTLNKELEEQGLQQLQKELQRVDPEYYAKIDPENPHRVIRALEVHRASGKPFSSFLGKKKSARAFNCVFVGLNAPRELVYERINTRVDEMIESGLVEEARNLYPSRRLSALQTVGYQELFRHFDGEYKLELAVSEIKKNTRRYAKRQLTWFNKREDIQWFSWNTPHSEILDYIMNISAVNK